MKPGQMYGNSLPRLRVFFCALGVLIVCSLFASSVVFAFPPEEPIPIPFFSFDASSPSVNPDPPGDPVPPDAVLQKGSQMMPQPLTVFSGDDIGLGFPGDDLDAFSFNRSQPIRSSDFVLLFSVGRLTTGDVPPDPLLVAANVPYNVDNQADLGHADGDGFITLNAYNSNGVINTSRSTSYSNAHFGMDFRVMTGNAQTINNFDEGGQDYQGEPPVSSGDPTSDDTDNVDGSASGGGGSRGASSNPGLYFSVTPDSESLIQARLPGGSGADIFYDADPTLSGLQASVPFATAQQLGLVETDDINALLVDDADTNGVFTVGDRVYFSLTADSPSLNMLPFIGSNGAADILVAGLNSQGQLILDLFAHGGDMGLIGANDDVDSLEIVPLDDEPTAAAMINFARLVGIRRFPGDWNNDGVIGTADIEGFVDCMSGPRQGVNFSEPPVPCGDILDLNGDKDVDLADFNIMVQIFGSTPGL